MSAVSVSARRASPCLPPLQPFDVRRPSLPPLADAARSPYNAWDARPVKRPRRLSDDGAPTVAAAAYTLTPPGPSPQPGPARTLPPLYAAPPPWPRQKYNTASSLSKLVSNVCNAAADLAALLDTPAADPPPPRTAAEDFATLDAIGKGLEAVYMKLLTRADALRGPVPPPLPSPSPAPHTPHAHADRADAYTAHLSSLRHSLSSLTVAHETLASEHKNLLSAMARSQKRAETMDKKMASLTTDNENFAAEKDKLVGNIESLEDTVGELREDRDQARDELLRTGLQWSQIIGNTTKLDRLDARERDARRKELEELGRLREKTLHDEAELRSLREIVHADNDDEPGYTGGGSSSSCGGGAGRGAELIRLRRDNDQLRKQIAELQAAVEAMRVEASEMTLMAQRMASIGAAVDGIAGRLLVERRDRDRDKHNART